jgi:iron-sulfur cluster insertion protein
MGPQAIAGGPDRPYFQRMSTPDIDLTPSAAARVALIAQKTGKPAILRLAIDGGGCAGFQYKFELAEAAADDDLVATRDGVTLVVDPMSLDLVRGGAVDYVESLGGAAFRVTNPNAASGCGCGSSFSI